MAEETQKPAAEAPPAAAELVVVSDVSVKEKEVQPQPEPESTAEKSATVIEKEATPQPEPSGDKPAAVEEVVEASPEEKARGRKNITESASFKEESNVVGELPDPQKKALDEFKQLVQEALNKHEFTAPPPPPQPVKEEVKPAEPAKEEEKPTEEKPAAVVAESKSESKPQEKTEVPSAATAEVPKVEIESAATTSAAVTEEVEKATTPPPPPPAAAGPSEPPVVAEVVRKVEAVVAEVVQKVEVVDEDGAKTVEAIKETIVEVSTSTAAAAAPEEAAPAAEAPPPVTTEEREDKAAEETPAAPPPPPEEVSIWGIPLLADERSDVILLKFLRARDFKVKDAFAMLKNVVAWRKEFGIESLLEEDLGNELDKVAYMHGVDKEGHPVCYNAYGEFQNKELYQNTFADEEKRNKFLRWRIQFLEKSIRKLDFSPDGINTIVQINDLKNSPGLFMWELRQATNQALQLLQDNYPEFVAKQVFINVPWWYLAFYRMISPFFTQRTKSKFVFAGLSKSTETLFKYVAPEQVPVQYGGLSREGEQEFSSAEPATEEIIKPSSKHTVEFPVSEACHLVWEVRVVGWEVSYGAEFVPSAEGGYTVIVQKSRKIGSADDPVISNGFKIGEPGKVVLTFDSQSSKKKKLLYRSKTKPSD